MFPCHADHARAGPVARPGTPATRVAPENRVKTRDAESAPGTGAVTAEPEESAGYPAGEGEPITFRPLVMVTVAALSVLDRELMCLVAPGAARRGEGEWSL